MTQATLLGLPVEIRLEIYSYFLPTSTVQEELPCVGDSLRLTCRLIKDEYDHEVLRDIIQYHKRISLWWERIQGEQLLAPLRNCVQLISTTLPTTYHSTRKLELNFQTQRLITADSHYIKHEIWSGLIIPHIRSLTLRFESPRSLDPSRLNIPMIALSDSLVRGIRGEQPLKRLRRVTILDHHIHSLSWLIIVGEMEDRIRYIVSETPQCIRNATIGLTLKIDPGSKISISIHNNCDSFPKNIQDSGLSLMDMFKNMYSDRSLLGFE